MRKMYSKKQIEEIAKSSGTKLYKHYLFDSGGSNHKFILITTNPEPIDFFSLDSYINLYNYLISQNVIRFTNDSGDNVQCDYKTDHNFYLVNIVNDAPSIQYLDDWSIINTTDTVTPL